MKDNGRVAGGYATICHELTERCPMNDPDSNPAAFLGAELRRARVAAGFASQEALAVKLGYDRSVIAKAETGERPPTPEVADALDAELFPEGRPGSWAGWRSWRAALTGRYRAGSRAGLRLAMSAWLRSRRVGSPVCPACCSLTTTRTRPSPSLPGAWMPLSSRRMPNSGKPAVRPQ